MTKDPSKVKRCPECKRLVDSSTMRPLSRTPQGGAVRVACPDCFQRPWCDNGHSRWDEDEEAGYMVFPERIRPYVSVVPSVEELEHAIC